MVIIVGNGIGDLSSNPELLLCSNALGKKRNLSVLSSATGK